MDSEYALRRPGAGMVAEVIGQTFYTALCAPCLWLGAKGRGTAKPDRCSSVLR